MTGTSRGRGRELSICARPARRSARTVSGALSFLVFVLTGAPGTVLADGLLDGRVIAASDTGAVIQQRAAMMRAVDELRGAAPECTPEISAKDCAVTELKAFVDGLRTLGTAEQLAAVNREINRARYVSDSDNYGWRDYWAAPSALLTRGGDCEDYALAKYAALRLLGVPDSAMRIFVARHKPRRVAHAVLVVTTGGTTHVLDNESDGLRSIGGTGHLKPLFALNQSGYWLYMQI